MATSAGMVVAMPSMRNSRERPQHAPDGDVAVAAPHDELADEVVVVLADRVARLVAAVPAGAEAVGRARASVMWPGDGRNLPPAGFSALTRTSMAWPQSAMSSWRERQRQARGHPDLLGDEVDARHHLGDGVLDLQPGVHLEEEELAVLEEELDGAGVVVAACLARP